MFVIRRPAVWTAVILIITILAFNIISQKRIYKKQYYLDDMFKNKSRIETIIYGEFESAISKEKTVSIILKNVRLKFDGRTTEYKDLPSIIIYAKKSNGKEKLKLNPENKIKCNASLMELKSATNPGEFNMKAYYREKKIFYSAVCDIGDIVVLNGNYNHLKKILYNFRDRLKNIYADCMPEREAGTVSAMLLGDKSMLDEEVKELYRENGMSHLLAISGLHITVLCMAFNKLLTLLKVPDKLSITLTVLLLFLYGIMTGFGISTNRAVIMMVIALFAGFVGRSYDMLSATAVSAVIIVILKPMALFSCSFLLSYGAIIAIAYFYPFLRDDIFACRNDFKHNNKERLVQHIKKEIIKSMLVSFSIQFFTLPVILYYFFQTPSYSIVLNLLIVPLSTFLVIISALGGLLGIVFLPLGKFMLGGAYFILKFYDGVCELFNKLPMHHIVTGRPGIIKIFIFYLVSFTLIFAVKYLKDYIYIKKDFDAGFSSVLLSFSAEISKISHYTFLLFMVLYVFMLIPPQNDRFNICFLDVGQGDCIIIKNDNGKVYMIDGGSSDKDSVGKYIITPYLKYYGIEKIDYCIMTTHSDSDHISGIIEIFEQKNADRITIDNFLLPNPDNELKDEAYYQILRLAKNNCNKVRYVKTYDKIIDGDMTMTCVHPDNGCKTDSANAYSAVLSIVHKNNSILLTGDLEKDGEDKVLDILNSDFENFPQKYTLLKAAHHGSKNSTTEAFLRRTMPEKTIISCGKNNRYGHPHSELLKKLEYIETKIYRTDVEGALNFEE